MLLLHALFLFIFFPVSQLIPISEIRTCTLLAAYFAGYYEDLFLKYIYVCVCIYIYIYICMDSEIQK